MMSLHPNLLPANFMFFFLYFTPSKLCYRDPQQQVGEKMPDLSNLSPNIYNSY